MRVDIKSNNFGDINMAVLYRFHNFTPSFNTPSRDTELFLRNLNNFSDSIILIRGSKNNLGLESFMEYDFRHIADKKKYSDIIKPSLFSDQLLKDVGNYNVEVLDKLSNCIFPTLDYNTQRSNSISGFFGSTLINDKTVYVIPASGKGIINNNEILSGVWKIELYEDVALDSFSKVTDRPTDNDFLKSFLAGIDSVREPAVVIYLGPDSECRNNSTEMYLSSDIRRDENNRSDKEKLNESEYWNLQQEVDADKLVILSLSQGDGSMEVNLSYKTWINSHDPNRNMKKYFLRNDYFWSSNKSLNVFDNSIGNNIIIDHRSGTLVGTKLVENSPILKMKRSRLNEMSVEEYSPYKSYSTDERVTWMNNIWVSLRDHNLNNSPLISSAWILEDKIESILTTQAFVDVFPENSAKINPSGNVTVNENATKVFEYIPSLGFEIDKTNPIRGVKAGDFELSNDPYSSGNVSGIKTTLVVRNWKNIFYDGNNTITFNFLPVSSMIEMSLCDVKTNTVLSGSRINDWNVYFPETNISNIKLIELGDQSIDHDLNEVGNFDNIAVGSVIELLIPDMDRYQPDSLESIETIDNINKSKTLKPEKISGGWIIKDTIFFNSAQWTLNLIPREYTIITSGTSTVEISSPIVRLSSADKVNCIIKFYFSDGRIGKPSVAIKESGKVISHFLELGKSVEINSTIFILNYNSSEDMYLITVFGNIFNDFNITIR